MVNSSLECAQLMKVALKLGTVESEAAIYVTEASSNENSC
jgi:hypothetical protein